MQGPVEENSSVPLDFLSVDSLESSAFGRSCFGARVPACGR